MKKGHRVVTAWINSPQAQEVAEFYVCGHTVKETAAKFCVSTVQVNNLVKKRGITNGLAWAGRHQTADQEARKRENVFSEYVSQMGFDYLWGYENKNSRVRIKCKSCGAEFERTVGFLRKGHAICKECQKREAQRRHEEQAEIKRLTDEIHRLWNPPKPSKNAYAEQHERFLLRSGVCEICGKSYTVREYVESCALKKAQDNGVCSRECRDEKKRRKCRAMHKGRKDTHRHRAKKYGCEYDPGVTLKKLVARDGLECKICGQMCDWDDHSWSKYSGPLYPSIDHIVPMSKGGGHVWGNVQVTHIICNSEKGDRIEEVNA